jgi:hypothetical protein
MGEKMMCRVRAQVALALALAVPFCTAAVSPAWADLPQVKKTDANTPPACATPGRLMSFLRDRNGKLDDKFDKIAVDYMRIGEELNIRWDTAFFQMLLETGNLTFTGDVSIKQNNFAGLGATGRGAPGETFPDVATGVRAHLEHLLLYAGEKLDNPVAERTRKVQEWDVLGPWQKTINRPMTFADVAKKWAPSTRRYARDIEDVAESFEKGACKSDDPSPELLAEATGKTEKKIETAAALPVDDTGTPKITGADLAKRAVEEARTTPGAGLRTNLGASALAANADAATKAAPKVTILNAPVTVTPEAEASVTPAIAETSPAKETTAPAATTQLAALSTAAATALKPPASKPSASTCKVWTASYGGSRAVIIRAKATDGDNYTVLDVNEGAEKREADAYIAAYAKGGETVGEFTNTTQALDKAFELCPEG